MGPNWSEIDIRHMRAALDRARVAAEVGEVPVGAVVVRDGEIIGAGGNRSISEKDPSAHAEIVALREAACEVDNHRIPGATVYVTLEPCPMCMGAMSQARIDRLVFAAYDPKAGSAGSAIDLSESRALNHHFEVNGGLMAEECGELLSTFFRSKR